MAPKGGVTKDADQRRRAAELAARADELSLRVLEVTAPIYRPDERRRPEAIGSAVLLALGDARFLVTAGHVLDLAGERPWVVPAGDQLLNVHGQGYRLFLSGATALRDDSVDIGTIRLAGEAWSSAPSTAFASWPELDLVEAVMTRNAFGLVGYPSAKQRHSVKGTTLAAQAYQFAGLEAPQDVYRAEGINPAVNLIVGFNKRRTLGPNGPVTAPDLFGVSGAGLWRFGRFLRHATLAARLSGIVIEWRRSGRNKYVMATRIRPIIAKLADRYPDVEEFVNRQTHAGHKEVREP